MKQTRKTLFSLLSKIGVSVMGIPLFFYLNKKGDGFLLQAAATIPDTKNKVQSIQKGGKFYISSHAIDSEVIGVAWKAVQTFILHEAREGFLYKGQPVYGPHFGVEDMVEFCKTHKEVSR